MIGGDTNAWFAGTNSLKGGICGSSMTNFFGEGFFRARFGVGAITGDGGGVGGVFGRDF